MSKLVPMDKITITVNGKRKDALLRKMWCGSCNGLVAHIVMNCGTDKNTPPNVKIQTICSMCGFDKDGFTAQKINLSVISIPDWNALCANAYL